MGPNPNFAEFIKVTKITRPGQKTKKVKKSNSEKRLKDKSAGDSLIHSTRRKLLVNILLWRTREFCCFLSISTNLLEINNSNSLKQSILSNQCKHEVHFILYVQDPESLSHLSIDQISKTKGMFFDRKGFDFSEPKKLLSEDK